MKRLRSYLEALLSPMLIFAVHHASITNQVAVFASGVVPSLLSPPNQFDMHFLDVGIDTSYLEEQVMSKFAQNVASVTDAV